MPGTCRLELFGLLFDKHKFLGVEQHVGQVGPRAMLLRRACTTSAAPARNAVMAASSSAVGGRPKASTIHLLHPLAVASVPRSTSTRLRPRCGLFGDERIVEHHSAWAGTFETLRRPIVVKGVG